MRKKQNNQMSLMITSINHQRTTDLEAIRNCLDGSAILFGIIGQDLTRNIKKTQKEVQGITAERGARNAIG